MMNLISEQIKGNNAPNGEKVRNIVDKRTARNLWADAQTQLNEWRNGASEEIALKLEETLTELFKAGDGDATMALLSDQQESNITQKRDEVITALAAEGVHVLRRGDLEVYCGTHAGQDKVATAIKFCSTTSSAEELKALHGVDGEDIVNELRSIFTCIYGDPVAAQ